MQKSYEEGLAIRLGPESYADDGNIVGVATAGVRTGQPLSSEIITSAGRPCSDMGKATSGVASLASHDRAAAESKTLSMCGNSKRENRETPDIPSAASRWGTVGEGANRTSHMHVSGESDDSVVPAKRTNKAGPKAAAESVEERESTEGNVTRTLYVPDTVPDQTWHRIARRTEGSVLSRHHPR
jgi:hypothetical protein